MAKRTMPSSHKPKHDPATSEYIWGAAVSMSVGVRDGCITDVGVLTTLTSRMIRETEQDHMRLFGPYGLMHWLRLVG